MLSWILCAAIDHQNEAALKALKLLYLAGKMLYSPDGSIGASRIGWRISRRVVSFVCSAMSCPPTGCLCPSPVFLFRSGPFIDPGLR